MLYNVVRHLQMGEHTSSLFVTVLVLLQTQCTEGLTCERVNIRYNDYGDMPFTVVAWNRRTGTAARAWVLRFLGRRQPEATVFRRQ
jgi:hypothetical protein